MKKLFLFFFISLFLFGLVSAGSCNPDSGYNKCWTGTETNSYGSCKAVATTEVQINNNIQVENGRKIGEYVTGDSYIPYKFQGDYFGLYEGREWDYIWNQGDCSKSGCSVDFDKTLSQQGKYYLTKNSGDSYNGGPAFVVWDHDLVEKSSCWAWTTKGSGYGWHNKGDVVAKQVECYDNSDCSSNEYCDKSGSWDDWSCEMKECDKEETKCESNDYYTCDTSDYTWNKVGKKVGECGVDCTKDSHCPDDKFFGDLCSGKEYIKKIKSYSCSENYECDYKINEESQGNVVGKCGVECLEDSECNEDTFVGETFCSSTKNVSRTFEDYYCDAEEKGEFHIMTTGYTPTYSGSLTCQYNETDKVLETCSDICQEGECINREWYEKPKNLLILAVSVIILIGGIYYYYKK